MSGIAGIACPGQAGEALLHSLAEMLEPMRGRFPDGECTHAGQSVVLGALEIDLDARRRLDGRSVARDDGCWLVFDGRIDGRDALLEALRDPPARSADSAITDAGLALLAYRRWGEETPAHLDGDFAFAVWDASRQRLLLVRDRFGIRPLYFARDAGKIAWASTTVALASLPWVDRRENASAQLDFLLFGYCTDAWATHYAGIEQVAPGHSIAFEAGRERKRRYWFPGPARVVGRRLDDFAGHFSDLLEQAVRDRLRAERVGVLLSGGLDSTAIAATAARNMDRPDRVHGFTSTCSEVWPGDAEGEYASQVARHSGFATSLLRMDDVQPLQDWHICSPPGLAPVNTMFMASYRRILGHATSHGVRLLFTGEGGDPGLESPSYHLRALLGGGNIAGLAREIAGAIRERRSLRGLGLRSLLPATRKPIPAIPFPGWLRPEVRREWDLDDRWHRIHDPSLPVSIRSEALADSLADNTWYLPTLEQYEGAWAPMVVTHPFLDRRLLEYAMALPQFAVNDKLVLRRAMEGVLPSAVAQRPKAHFPFDLVRHWLGEGGWRFPAQGLERVQHWVDPDLHAAALRTYLQPGSKDAAWDGIRLMLPAALSGWIDNATRAGVLAPPAMPAR